MTSSIIAGQAEMNWLNDCMATISWGCTIKELIKGFVTNKTTQGTPKILLLLANKLMLHNGQYQLVYHM